MPFNTARAGRAMLAGLLAAGALTGAAHAAADAEFVVQQPDTQSVRVAISDLDLNVASDQRTLANRVNSAARDVCEIGKGSLLDNTASARDCVAGARAGALAQLDARGYHASWAVAQVQPIS